MSCHALLAFLLLAVMTMPAGAQSPTRGIAEREAPAWNVTEWINLPAGRTTLDVADLRGKVVYLYCFQSWCPGCHSRGFPTLTQLIRKYADADDVAFVAIQTTFEGFETNTASRAWETARKYDLKIPVGHDGEAGQPSPLMRRYKSGGTPWAIIIDKSGVIRFNDFHTTTPQASRLIDALRAGTHGSTSNESTSEPAPIETLPASRGGQDIIGKKLPRLTFNDWIDSAGRATSQPVRGRPTLYRWWTDTCPYCEASLPAFELLRRKYPGLDVVGAYHPKPARAVSRERVAKHARRLGYAGRIAIDSDWSALRRAYLDGENRRATSISILVDGDGVIRFVHPGPILFPSDDPKDARENADFVLLEKAIRGVLHE